jgi:hypothetical protein
MMLPLPAAAQRRAHIQRALAATWGARAARIAALPIAVQEPALRLPLRLRSVALPPWSAAGIDGRILIPEELGEPSDDWRQIDWWTVAFVLLEGWHERCWEARHGVIHSYSLRLRGWDPRVWQHAWVNRIARWLDAWAAHEDGRALPAPNAPSILMTHDVDAVARTLPIQLKQSAFHLWRALGALRSGRLAAAGARLQRIVRLFRSADDWWTFDRLLAMERAWGIQATYHIFATPRAQRNWLMDPGYDVAAAPVQRLLAQLRQHGHHIGLHPGFDAWNAEMPLAVARQALAAASNVPVDACRQHWLRFSWGATWRAQSDAGLRHDTTLMFNDRPGFRTAAALSWHPWDQRQQAPHRIRVTPSILMDSHLYDYQPRAPAGRRDAIAGWLAEVRQVGGQAAVVWHPHTLSDDYGWAAGFDELLMAIGALTGTADPGHQATPDRMRSASREGAAR